MSDIDIKVMQSFIDTMVGIPKFSYPAKKNAPRPDPNEFAHIQLLEEYQEGIPHKVIDSQDDLTTDYHTICLARLRYRIGIIETDGSASIKIMHGWTTDVIKQLMFETEYGFISCHPISLEDAKLEVVEWEPRQGFTIEMYVERRLSEVVDNITGMTISGKVITPNLDTILMDIEINNEE